MPSGITSDIYDNKDMSLRAYLVKVGGQFGFAHYGKLDGTETARTDYYDQSIKEAKQTLAEAARWSIKDALKAAREDFERRHAEWRESEEERLALLARYGAMYEKVEAWDEPTEGPISEIPIKDKALKYLDESMAFDCKPFREEPTQRNGMEHKLAVIAAAQRDLSFATGHRDAEINRVKERNEANKAFQAALPPEENA